MAFQLSPGVSVTEQDLTTIVPAVATTNAGIAGQFSWGPVDQRIIVNSEDNLVKQFGLPDNNTYSYFFTAANFLGYGNNLQVVRAVGSGALNSGARSPYLIRNSDVDQTGLTSTGPFAAKYPGALGNSLLVSICGGATGTTASASGTTFGSWAYASNFNGVPTTSLYDSSLGGSNDEFHVVVVDEDGLWTGVTGTVLERFTGLSIDPDAKSSDGASIFYKNKINTESKYITCPGPLTGNAANYSNTGLTSGATIPGGGSAVGYFSFVGSNSTNVSGGVFNYSLTGGADGANLGDGDLITSTNNSGVGYDLFSDAETVDVSLLLGGPLGTTGATNLVSLAGTRKDCIAFVSPNVSNPNVSESTKLSAAITFRNALPSSSYGVLDSGYKYQYDRYNDVYRWVPMNGDIAGLCVRTDISNDPWWSPAGYNRGQIRGAVKLAFNPGQTSRDELYKKGINPVVAFPGQGTILYGDKTLLSKPSAFDRINVRRLFIVLEKAIATAAKFSLFEFNDDFTRAQFKALVEPFLRDVQARRGITDFRVVCDSRNNTPEVIDSNRFVADIYIKPNRSINFIQLNFIATRSSVSFDEIA